MNYLSHGMGVNSTALMLLLTDEGEDFESVFVDHGGDYPETYAYSDYLQAQGFSVTVLTPNVSGCRTIEAYCEKYRITPFPHRRWCTQKFKVQPMLDYFHLPATVYIGFGGEEGSRSFNIRSTDGIAHEYPLVARNITRPQCIQIIKDHGLEVPPRSGCWMCPFKTKAEVRQLMLRHPGLYERRKAIEKNCRNEGVYLTRHTPIEDAAMENTPSILSDY